MGQAKRRGTYDQRKAQAIERDSRERFMKSQLFQHRPSPKHVALMATVAAFTLQAGGKE